MIISHKSIRCLFAVDQWKKIAKKNHADDCGTCGKIEGWFISIFDWQVFLISRASRDTAKHCQDFLIYVSLIKSDSFSKTKGFF